LKAALAGTGIEVAAGADALVAASREPVDMTIAGIVGAAGLDATLAAIQQGSVVALANKECLVCAGDLVLEECARAGTTLLPLDSEHNAIFQVFETENAGDVEKLILTASGGPFRTWALAEMARATPDQAVAHPNWDMGRKISVDSATMMNKGLELIEAAYLFPVDSKNIDVLVHAQSVVHSLVAYTDGSMLAQLGPPDMRVPIAHALAWPARMKTPVERLDLASIGSLDFELPDKERFPAIALARSALETGNGSTAVLNAANEIAVQSFLDNLIGFLDIATLVEKALDQVVARPVRALDDFRDLDTETRAVTESLVKSVS
ncbi:MAG: 1-deoxy-D-xylulose-5-phosphate reductoisomerase, partial [Alphaproteobacteria bacterium]|nr:1-deoxy-D-xylulose-5-phosphate reductoisomerase [Alphaproteobacteria bacterium]